MSDTSTTIRERVAEAMHNALYDCGHARPLEIPTLEERLIMADAAIAVIVEVFRNGQASLLEEGKDGELGGS